jgi:hypothetical protein
MDTLWFCLFLIGLSGAASGSAPFGDSMPDAAKTGETALAGDDGPRS